MWTALFVNWRLKNYVIYFGPVPTHALSGKMSPHSVPNILTLNSPYPLKMYCLAVLITPLLKTNNIISSI